MSKTYFSSSPVFGIPLSRIDREKGILYGVTISQLGPAKSHGGNIDRIFLAQIVEQAAKRPQGLKARFGHPNMCSTALGTYLGRFKNYTLHDDNVKADLYLDVTSKSTPGGNLFDYVLDMAEKNPDMLGASIVFEAAEFETDPLAPESPKLFRLKDLRATDIVDDPAATDSLFSADTLPAQASMFLDNNPELAELIFSKPESVIEFLNNYMHNNMNLPATILARFQKLFGIVPDADPVVTDPVPADPVPDPTADLALANQNLLAEIAEAEKRFEDFSATAEKFQNDLKTQLDAATSAKVETEKLASEKIASLESQLESYKTHNADLVDRLAAKPSIPSEVTDPQVSTAINISKDEAGKDILKSMPTHVRRKLKDASK